MAADSGTQQWARVLAPFILASLVGGFASLIIMRQQVADMRQQVSKGILPVTEERILALQLQMLQLRHEHEAALQKIEDLEHSGTSYCLRCHMQQQRNHPPVQHR